jgi:hypothetical protein
MAMQIIMIRALHSVIARMHSLIRVPGRLRKVSLAGEKPEQVFEIGSRSVRALCHGAKVGGYG